MDAISFFENFHDPRVEPSSPPLQVDSLSLSHHRTPQKPYSNHRQQVASYPHFTDEETGGSDMLNDLPVRLHSVNAGLHLEPWISSMLPSLPRDDLQVGEGGDGLEVGGTQSFNKLLPSTTQISPDAESIPNRDVRMTEAMPSGNSQPNEGDRPIIRQQRPRT